MPKLEHLLDDVLGLFYRVCDYGTSEDVFEVIYGRYGTFFLCLVLLGSLFVDVFEQFVAAPLLCLNACEHIVFFIYKHVFDEFC